MIVNPIPQDKHVFIIGAMKAGTSSFFDYLSGNEHLCLSKIKETEYFSENTVYETFQVEDYLDLYDWNPQTHRFAVEASTGYAKYPWESNVVKNILEYGISPKIVYLVRDPFDRIESHYNFKLSRKREITHEHHLAVSNYFLQLEQYRAHFPLENFLILDFALLKSNPRKVLDQFYDFLGFADSQRTYPESFAPSNVTHQMTKYERMAFGFKEGNRRLVRKIPKPLRALLKAIVRSAPAEEKVTLTAEQRAFVHEQLKEDMLRFEEVYGFDVSQWGFSQS